ncbi:MAG: hypothetical protein K9M51_02960 [Candidatus Gracilibacteria bacterium]|nr:hypothetical protein [Candidatus Gracilibacteria bacterium]
MGKLFDENNAKVAAITATLGWMDTKGGTKARLAGAIKWGLVGAILTQPTLTNTVSDLARAAGNTIGVGASVMAPELVIRMIDDPGSFFKAIEKSKQDKNASSVYDILRHGSDVPEQQRETLLEDKDIFRLREEFPLDPKLNSVIDAILLYQKQEAVFDTPPTFPADELQKAAEFVVKAEEEIQLSDKEFDDRLRRINEGKGTLSDQFAPNEIKQMIATSAYNEIMVFFLHEDRPEALQQEFEKQFSLALAKKQNGEMETLDLETDVLDETKISNEDLQDLNTKEKTGIRRILGMGLTKNALLVTVLTFLLTSGIVKLRGIIQRDWWKEKGEKVKKFSLLPFKSLDSLKNNFKRFKRKIKKWGKKKFGWSDEQVKTFEGLKASQKKDVKKKFFSIADDKKAKYEERKKAAPKGEKPKKREELEFTKDEFNQLFSSLPEEKRILLQVSD